MGNLLDPRDTVNRDTSAEGLVDEVLVDVMDIKPDLLPHLWQAPGVVNLVHVVDDMERYNPGRPKQTAPLVAVVRLEHYPLVLFYEQGDDLPWPRWRWSARRNQWCWAGIGNELIVKEHLRQLLGLPTSLQPTKVICDKCRRDWEQSSDSCIYCGYSVSIRVLEESIHFMETKIIPSKQLLGWAVHLQQITVGDTDFWTWYLHGPDQQAPHDAGRGKDEAECMQGAKVALAALFAEVSTQA